MYSGAAHTAYIKDTVLMRINSSKWDVETLVFGKKFRLIFDFTEKNRKELIDPELLLAVVNEDVHKIDF